MKATNTKIVEILVIGHHSILAAPTAGQTDLSVTWQDFLETCDAKLTTEKEVCVQTFQASGKRGPGWRAELHEPIGEFMAKFCRIRLSTTVRLVLKDESKGKGNRTAGGFDPPISNHSTVVTRSSKQLATRTSIVVTRASAKSASMIQPNVSHTYPKPLAVTENPQGRYETRQSLKMVTTDQQSVTPRKPKVSSARKKKGGAVRRVKRKTVGKVDNVRRVVLTKVEIPEDEVIAQPDISVEVAVKNENHGVPVISNIRSLALKTEQDEGFMDNEAMDTEETLSESSDANGDLNADNVDWNNETSIANFMKALEEEVEDMQNRGIEVEDVKTSVEQTLADRFNNPWLLRIRNEIQTAMQNGEWNEQKKEGPLFCYLLEQILL